jgi:hypothetical protein
MKIVEVGTPEEVLYEAISRCAKQGSNWIVLNADDEEIAWAVESDTKVDDDDLTYPVIVHMRGGILFSDSVAVLRERS